MASHELIKTLIQGGRWGEAKRVCAKLCRSSANNADAWLLMGVIHGQFENFGEAEKCCRRVIALSPSTPVGYFNLGITLQKQRKFSEAARGFRQAILLNPNYAEAHNELGVALQLSGEEAGKAVESYQRAIALKPDYAEAHYNLATVLRDKAMVIDAEMHFREAILLRPGMLKAHDALGQLCLSVGYLDKAFAVYQEAIYLHPDESSLHFLFATVLMAMGRNQEALKNLQHVLELSPGNTKVYASMAKALEREGKFEDGYELLHPLLGGDDVDVALAYAALARHLGHQKQAMELLERVLKRQVSIEQCKSVHFALGKLYDEAQNYEQAFTHWRSANELGNRKFDLEKNAQLFADLKSVFSVENSSRHPRATNQSALPVFIVGMPRSGTSLVEQILASHPAVHGAGELHDIGNLINMLPAHLGNKVPYPHSLDAITGAQLDDIAAGHLQKLANLSPQSSHVTDKMPHNFRHLGMIDMLFPGARVIHCMRDPVDTCLSIYSLPFSANHTYAADLAQLGAYYQQYQDLMAHWKKVLRIPMLEVQYEEIVSNQEAMTRKMIEFCGLEWDERCLNFHKSERVVTTPSYDQVRRPIYKKSVTRWKNYEHLLEPLIAALSPSLADVKADE